MIPEGQYPRWSLVSIYTCTYMYTLVQREKEGGGGGCFELRCAYGSTFLWHNLLLSHTFFGDKIIISGKTP